MKTPSPKQQALAEYCRKLHILQQLAISREEFVEREQSIWEEYVRVPD